MGEVYLRVSHHGKDTLVAVCDADLLGKTLGGGRVPFKVSEEFYRGILGNVEEAIKAMKRGTICNLVGKEIVEAAVNERLVNNRAIIYFGDIPHAQIIKL